MNLRSFKHCNYLASLTDVCFKNPAQFMCRGNFMPHWHLSKAYFRFQKHACNREYTPFSIFFCIFFCLTTAAAFLPLALNVREYVKNKLSVERAIPRALHRVISLKLAEPSQIVWGRTCRKTIRVSRITVTAFEWLWFFKTCLRMGNFLSERLF